MSSSTNPGEQPGGPEGQNAGGHHTEPIQPGADPTTPYPVQHPPQQAQQPYPQPPSPYTPYPQGPDGQPPVAPGYYRPPTPPNTSAIVLTVVSGLLVITVYCCPIGAIPLVLGVLGMAQQASDPESARRMTTIGWVVLIGLTILALAAIIAITAIAVGAESTA
ncbi:hypothetical protein [Janibacter corallicola]|uniref:hypothetical protein n=1 Tax=Janibacter corallicola TaxID=415212 RepID=UPI000832DC1F|nr:hypothetical protein [Janibacter corallicola]